MANTKLKRNSLKKQDSLRLQSLISDIQESHQRSENLLALLFHEHSKLEQSLTSLKSLLFDPQELI